MAATTDADLAVAAAKIKLAELYEVHDHFFCADKAEKQSKLRALADDVVALVDTIPLQEHRQLRATVFYVKGKALDAFPSYDATAEQLLSQAAKLDPCNLDAWVALGNCFWKKGDLVLAKHCFENCLEYGSSKHALRSLSMVLRKLGTKPEDKADHVRASLQHAKQAVGLDLTDGESWYVLGNAYLALFFGDSHSTVDLDRSLAAYTRAEKAGAGQNPDLHFNRANVHRYKEDYAEAVASYLRAHELDPSLRAIDLVDAIVQYTKHVSGLVLRKARLSPKKLSQLAGNVPPPVDIQGRTPCPIASLQLGLNEGVVIALKLLADVPRNHEPPGCFIMMDGAETSCAVSVYHLDSEASVKITDDDTVYVLDPCLKVMSLTYNGTVQTLLPRRKQKATAASTSPSHTSF
ncbi:hypothetical protein SPRG_05049 [Saprolegnia parasitica CBS 223.65]|uniref:Tetratricopeptide repeat protein 5 OB fold domain-containing protein n=1 Tax=Saprolegnia parasitica (strain CBS 223.65) TaxID=695850 RepID=A0A067CIK2_SAPPC|nr:hypothetical protein SPRG_05049 [Saprolegnia parasitica CBS 223.65]KDO30338.1 hypothetical protein SPRG_05049 [Saprolegnia parasitica CBS 223.65]|eukprot:XP_012198948.1 hypothetical protein SPRG_05049 [Saprolegnia parasitica CBS 223.65]